MLTNEQIRDNVQANFKHVRCQFGLTTKAMGTKLGLSQKTYSAIEEGRSVTIINIYKLSRIIGCTIDAIISTKFSK